MATERRFHAIEEGQRLAGIATESRQNAILIALNELTATVKQQNSRVGKLEKFRSDMETAQAYAKGIVEGGAKMGAKQLALLAVVGPLIFAGIGYALRIWT